MKYGSSTTVAVPTVSVTEAAQRLGVTRPTIVRFCNKDGWGVRIGGQFRIPESLIIELERKLIACAEQR